MRSLKKQLLDENMYYDNIPITQKSVIVHQETTTDSLKVMLRSILSLMRALHWELITAHWLASGPSFYGNHGMFSEMYKSTEDNFDQIAEKIMGHYSTECDLDPLELMKLSYVWLKKIADTHDLYERALKLEMMLLELIKECKEMCQDFISPGMANMLDEISDNHEKHVYFLKQAMKNV